MLRTMKAAALAALLMLCCGQAAAAEGLKDEQQVLALTQRMMETAMTREPDAVFALLKPHYPVDPAEIDALSSNARMYWAAVATRFGKPLAYERVQTERIGTSFVRYTYLQKFEKHALRWTFSFYRPKDTWLANTFKFDDAIESLYQAD